MYQISCPSGLCTVIPIYPTPGHNQDRWQLCRGIGSLQSEWLAILELGANQDQWWVYSGIRASQVYELKGEF